MKALKLFVCLAMAGFVIACGPKEDKTIIPPTPSKPDSGDPKPPTPNPHDDFVFNEAKAFASDLFERWEDPSSHVVSYILKSENDDGSLKFGWECSQSSYFNAKSMTNDGRFIFFLGSNKGYAGGARCGMIIDLKTRKIHRIDNCGFLPCPYVDLDEDRIYYGKVTDSNKNRAKFYRRDLLVDPTKEIPLAELPSSLIPAGIARPIKRLANHLTLTQDKKKVLLDMRIGDEFVMGLLDLYSGAWDEWYRGDVNLTHGQLHPKRDDLALMATDHYDKLDGTEVPIVKDPEPYEGFPNGVYPRIQIVSKGSRYTMLPDTEASSGRTGGYASHERWDESGDWVYWCSGGVCIRKLTNAHKTGEPSNYTNIVDGPAYYKYTSGTNVTTNQTTSFTASHCFFSTDHSMVTFDDQSPDYYRSCRWKVRFFNIKTRKWVFIHTLLPALVSKEDSSSAYQNWHTDPHPQFNCNDNYIICTAQREDKTIRLSITPVKQLLDMTR